MPIHRNSAEPARNGRRTAGASLAGQVYLIDGGFSARWAPGRPAARVEQTQEVTAA